MMARWPTPFAVTAWLGGLGLVVGLAGMVLERRWLVWIAAGCLSVAFLMRFTGKPHP
jgi:hypothetical protein